MDLDARRLEARQHGLQDLGPDEPGGLAEGAGVRVTGDVAALERPVLVAGEGHAPTAQELVAVRRPARHPTHCRPVGDVVTRVQHVRAVQLRGVAVGVVRQDEVDGRDEGRPSEAVCVEGDVAHAQLVEAGCGGEGGQAAARDGHAVPAHSEVPPSVRARFRFRELTARTVTPRTAPTTELTYSGAIRHRVATNSSARSMTFSSPLK